MFFKEFLAANDSKQLWEQFASINFSKGFVFFLSNFFQIPEKVNSIFRPSKSIKSRIRTLSPSNIFSEKLFFLLLSLKNISFLYEN